jgi:hypothetical protein
MKDLSKLVVFGLLAAGLALVVACGSSGVLKGDVSKTVFDAMNQPVGGKGNADGNAALWLIQPGWGTVMIEYNTRIANAYFAAKAGNWDMTKYQLMEMKEVQEVGETTRPARADDIKKFEADQLDPLLKTAEAKDLNAFMDQYPRTINGCNSCHKKQTSSDFPNGYNFVKVTVPQEPATKNIDWAGQ